MLPYIDTPFVYVADALGASADELKVIVSFLLSYPFAALLKRIPDSRPQQKNGFIILVSLFYLVGLLDLWSGIRTVLISATAAYAIAYYIHGSLMPWIGFAFIMGHMSLNHIQRAIVNDPSVVDISGAQMVMVMKLTAFCWNVHDGRLPEKDLDEHQKTRAIRRMPGFLDYAGFVLFFPSLFAGPAFDYMEYKRWVDTTMFDPPPGTDASKTPPSRKKRRIPRSGTPAAWKAAVGLLWIFAFLQLSKWFSPTVLLDDSYMDINILRRIGIMHMVGFTVRTKFYGVWHLTEGACILSGIGYAGVDAQTGRAAWDRVQNVNPLGIELAQNTRAYLGNWNMNTNNWLRNYMYLRVTPKGKKPGFRASMATFVTSAFWHGFEPGYYMSFVLASFLQTVAKNCRRFVRPFFLSADGKHELPAKRYYDVASWAVTQLAFSFTVMPFILLSLPDSLTVWSRVYFYCVVGVAAALAALSPPGKAALKQRLGARNRPKLERMDSTDSVGGARGPHMGLPDDPGRDLDEILEEVRREVLARRERGQSVSQGLQEAVQAKFKGTQVKAE